MERSFMVHQVHTFTKKLDYKNEENHWIQKIENLKYYELKKKKKVHFIIGNKVETGFGKVLYLCKVLKM